MRDVHNHVFSRIGETVLETDPFPHCCVRDVFPEDFYATLVEQLPEYHRYQKYPPPYESRLFLNVNADGSDNSPAELPQVK